MLAKLLALITQLKAAGVTAVIIAGAATVTVAGTSPEVQDTLQQIGNTVGIHATSGEDCERGQPAVVAQRNAADKLLRAAYQKDQKALEDLRGGKDTDNKAVGAVVKKYDDQLRTVLTSALNDVAAATLGREGQVRRSASPSPSTSPSASPTTSASPSARPSCSPAPSAGASPSTSASASPKPSASGKPDEEGRVTVALRTTLDANIKTIVDTAIAAMDDLVKKAVAEAGAVPSPEHGKPSDKPENSGNSGNKPSDNPGNKPDDAGKPSASPKR